MIVLLVHENGDRRLVSGDTWSDVSQAMSCADISATIISDVDFELNAKLEELHKNILCSHCGELCRNDDDCIRRVEMYLAKNDRRELACPQSRSAK